MAKGARTIGGRVNVHDPPSRHSPAGQAGRRVRRRPWLGADHGDDRLARAAGLGHHEQRAAGHPRPLPERPQLWRVSRCLSKMVRGARPTDRGDRAGPRRGRERARGAAGRCDPAVVRPGAPRARGPHDRRDAQGGGPPGRGRTTFRGIDRRGRGHRCGRGRGGRMRPGGRAALAGPASERERGAAVIEFVLVFLALVVPLVYAIVVMADVQRALLAVSTAAREVGRVYVTAATAEDAERRAALAYQEVLENYGYAAGDPRARLQVRAECTSQASGCLAGIGPGAEVVVRVTYRVPVARLPFIGAVAGPDLPIGATHHTRVDRYRGIVP